MNATKTRKSLWRWLVPAVAAVAVVAVVACVWIYGLPEFSEEEIRRLTAENLGLLLLVMLGVMVVQNLVTVIPLVAVISVNVALFGLPGGFAWSWITSLAGAIVAFAIARFGFQDLVSRRLKREWLERIEENGYLYVFLARLFPFAPSNLINYTAGVSVIPFRHYVASTALGNLIFQLTFSLLVEGLMSEGTGQIVSVAVFAVLLAAVLVYRRHRNKRAKQKE